MLFEVAGFSIVLPATSLPLPFSKHELFLKKVFERATDSHMRSFRIVRNVIQLYQTSIGWMLNGFDIDYKGGVLFIRFNRTRNYN